jgi:hypothetical protein
MLLVCLVLMAFMRMVLMPAFAMIVSISQLLAATITLALATKRRLRVFTLSASLDIAAVPGRG